MDKLSMAIIAMEAHVACSNERLRQAWEIIHAKLMEENGSSHNNESMPCEIGVYDEPCKLGYPCKCKHGCLIKRTAYIS